jgi:UDP-2,3-diacylglucosamine pyrophosphatase LpxH
LEKRKLDIVVISDVHLGTYGCRAKELCRYLSTIDPSMLILNGDIVDIWQFSKKFWPKSHMQVLKQITSMLSRGVKVYYVTGNHDEMLRRFEHFSLGDFHIVNKLVIHHDDGFKSWIFHGDVFDVTMKHSKWLAKLGAVGYDSLILLNSCINWISEKMGRGKISLSKKIKNAVKSAMKFINNFEQTAAEIAINKGYNYVVCGHIHQPNKKIIQNNTGQVVYLNSGDWVEHLTALEYVENDWNIYTYTKDILVNEFNDDYYLDEGAYLRTTELFKRMMEDFETTH